MPEYIQRESLLKRLEVTPLLMYGIPHHVRDGVLDLVSKQPVADVAEAQHGWWDDTGRYTFQEGGTAVRRSECGCALTVSEYRLYTWNYCPMCGTRMDKSGTQPQREDV